jgi:hypothetical protein
MAIAALGFIAADPTLRYRHHTMLVHNSVRTGEQKELADRIRDLWLAADFSGPLTEGGDLLYRWGNPAAYGATGPQQLFGQHNAQWIPAGSPGAGHILLFNNGDFSARPWSTAVEIVPPLREDGLYALDSRAGFGPSEPVWQYAADPPESLFGWYASGVQRLASGGTLIAVTHTGRFREVDDAGELIADYQLASNDTPLRVFRVTSIPPTSPAFATRPLVATGATLGQILYPQ